MLSVSSRACVPITQLPVLLVGRQPIFQTLSQMLQPLGRFTWTSAAWREFRSTSLMGLCAGPALSPLVRYFRRTFALHCQPSNALIKIYSNQNPGE